MTLIFSPRNIASIRARSPDSSASCTRSLSVSSVIAILRVIEVDPDSLCRQPLAALWVVGEELPEMHIPDLRMVSCERLPRRALGQCLAAWRSWLCSFPFLCAPL